MLPSLLRFADRLAVASAPGMLLYEDGFGDRAKLESLVRLIEDRSIVAADSEIELRLEPAIERRGVTIQRGTFQSPLADRLPEEARAAVVELRAPRAHRARSLVVMLASTGEEGFWLRSLFGGPLVEQGIATLSLESPFYGSRRPKGQRGPLLRTVSDQFAMNVATVQEARALARWALPRYQQVCLTGFSQGGFMAAFAGALLEHPVALVPRAAGDAAAPIFTSAALSRRIHWARLARDVGSEEQARRLFAEYLAPVRIGRFGVPAHARASVLVNVSGDGFVPRSESESLHRHWVGSELRWLTSNHVFAAIGHRGAQHQAILDALERLPR